MLELSDIHKSYLSDSKATEVLKGITLSVEKRELLAITGASGSGKTTLMNIIGLLDQPTSGTYLIGGGGISWTNDRELSEMRNKYMGFAFQQFHLLPRLNVLENVSLSLVYRKENRRQISERCLATLETVGMENYCRHKPNQLSGGQQQRVAIARAIAGSPSVILADEPTGALDTKTGQEIMDLFIRLNEERGVTVIIVSHNPNISKQCRRVLTLKDGFLF